MYGPMWFSQHHRKDRESELVLTERTWHLSNVGMGTSAVPGAFFSIPMLFQDSLFEYFIGWIQLRKLALRKTFICMTSVQTCLLELDPSH